MSGVGGVTEWYRGDGAPLGGGEVGEEGELEGRREKGREGGGSNANLG